MRYSYPLVLSALLPLAAPALAQTPAPKPAGTGLQAAYYNGTNFERLVLRRRDPAIDFDWQKKPPVEGLGQEYFSVRWEGYILAPVTGEYTFSTVMDDGLRVWVGGKRIIDAWKEQDHVPAVVRLRLEGGRYYRLRVDYFQTILDSRAVLRWALPGNPDELVPVGRSALFAALPATAKPIPPPRPAVAARPAVPANRQLVPEPPAPRPQPPTTRPATTPASRLAATPTSARRPTSAPARRPVVATRPASPPGRPATVAPAVTFGDSLTDLSKLRRGQAVMLRHLYFEQSKARLLPTSQPELNRLVRLLRAQPALRFEIAGHTDNVGDAQKNQVLSEQRARLVRAYLVQRGVDSLRLTAVGYGGTRPVADNHDPQQRPRNRRVELVMR